MRFTGMGATLIVVVGCSAIAAQAPRFRRTDEIVPAPIPKLVAIADFNDDGMDDLYGPARFDAVGSGLYAPAGAGASVLGFSNAAGRPPTVAVADFNGDGSLDIVQCDVYGDLRVTLWSSGSPPPNGLPSQPWPARSLAAGDPDGDGDADLVVSFDFQAPRLYVNDGSGLLLPQAGWFGLAWNATVVALRDLDGDGLDDLVARGAEVLLQRSLGGGAFDVPVFLTIPTVFGHRGRVEVGDVDGDGRLEILVGAGLYGVTDFSLWRLSPSTAWFTPIVVGSFSVPESAYGPEWTAAATVANAVVKWRPAARALVDADGDGDAELVYLSPEGVRVRDFVDGALGPASAPIPTWPEVLEPLHADEDGRIDLLAMSYRMTSPAPSGVGSPTGVEECLILFGDGAGGFAPARRTSESTAGVARSTALLDVDGDGDVDAASYVAPLPVVLPTSVVISRNDGRGVLAREAATPCLNCPLATSNMGPRYGLRAGDVDGDGDDDLFLHLLPTATVFLRNDGGAGFVAAASFGWSKSLETDDFDADGFVDAAALGSGVRVYYGGSTGPAPAVFIAPNHPHDSAMSVGDIDGDGDADLIVGRSFTQQWVIHVNQGARTFQTSSASLVYAPGAPFGFEMRIGDLDDDGNPDVIDQGGWWRQSPAMTFTHMGSVLAPVATIPVDLDEDGDLDLLGADGTVALNDGFGAFSTVGTSAAPLSTNDRFFVSDLDRDGDVDLVESDGIVHSNLRRHLELRRVGRPNRPFDFVIHGEASAPWWLAASLDVVGPMDAPPFGSLALDLGSLVVLANGVLDASGDFTLTATLDAASAAALAGTPFVFQALVGEAAGFRLTNACAAEVRNF